MHLDQMRETLRNFAADADLEIVSCDRGGLVLSVSLPSRGGETFEIRIASLIHLDMGPSMTLGKIEFGGLELLPRGYIDSRNFDYGGELAEYRTLRITDVDDKIHYVVGYGVETIVPASK